MFLKISAGANIVLLIICSTLFIMHNNKIKELEKAKYQITLCHDLLDTQNKQIEKLKLDTKEYKQKQNDIHNKIESKYNTIATKQIHIKEVKLDCKETQEKYKQALKELAIIKELIKENLTAN